MSAYLKNSHWDSNNLLPLGLVLYVLSTKKDALAQAQKLASFINSHPAQAVHDTMHLVKLSYAAEVADKESWLIAKKITESNETF